MLGHIVEVVRAFIVAALGLVGVTVSAERAPEEREAAVLRAAAKTIKVSYAEPGLALPSLGAITLRIAEPESCAHDRRAIDAKIEKAMRDGVPVLIGRPALES